MGIDDNYVLRERAQRGSLSEGGRPNNTNCLNTSLNPKAADSSFHCQIVLLLTNEAFNISYAGYNIYLIAY